MQIGNKVNQWEVNMSIQTNQNLILIFLFILIGALFCLVIGIGVAIYLNKKENIQIKIQRKSDFLYSSYIYFTKFTITKRYLQRIRRRIEIVELVDKWTVCRRTMRFAYISMATSFVLLTFLVVVSNTLYFFIISFFTVIIIHNQMQNILFDKIQFKILIQFEKFMGNVRHHYHEHGMIDEAIYDSIEECDYEMSLHASKMYEVLTSTDVENDIDEYYEVIPNKFFKTFLALCYTVQKFGDKIVDNQSIFLTNLNYLKQEINLEVLRTNRLNYLFKSLSIIAIAPIFFIKPIESWAVHNIPDLQVYFGGSYGFVVQIILFCVVLVSYQMINKMQKSSEGVIKSFQLEEIILKVPFLENIIEKLIDRNYSNSAKLAEFLKTTNARMNTKHFYTRKVLYVTVGILFTIFVIINIHNLNKRSIINYVDQRSIEVHNKKGEEDAIKQELIEFDSYFIKQYTNRHVDYEGLKKYIKETSTIQNDTALDITTTRIHDKIQRYNDQYFKWWQLIISLVIGLVFFNIPNLLLFYRRKIMEMDMEDEVMQFHTIILMLMYIEQITVEDILQWMEQFSFIFKNAIGKCLNDFENGDLEALEQLKMDEPFIPFSRIVDNLILASDKIAILEAFDELRIERNYYQEKRKQDNDIIINKKGVWGKLLAFLPLGTLMTLYLLGPFLMISVKQFFEYSNDMNSMIYFNPLVDLLSSII